VTEPAPIFDIDQPDGTRLAVDLSAPGEMGDFAFRVTGDGRKDYFCAYHLYESAIFVDVLLSLTCERDTADVLGDVQRIRREVEAVAVGHDRTRRSENTFEHHLAVLRAPSPLPAADIGGEYRIEGHAAGTLAVSRTPAGLFFALRGRTESHRERSVTVPVADLWLFAAGMMWRSYADDYGMSLSRLSTDAYDMALDAFEQSIPRR